jgi:hypothetical protein
MPWDNSPEKRARDKKTYADPEYRRNRAVAKRRANGTCEGCNHRHGRLQCDHDTPVSKGGTHHLDNLRMLCTGDGTCRCHERKTAREGGGYRQPGRNRGAPAPDPPLQQRTNW